MAKKTPAKRGAKKGNKNAQKKPPEERKPRKIFTRPDGTKVEIFEP